MGAQGSGSTLPPVANTIRSLHFLTIGEDGQVKQYRIEPKDGAITDPYKFDRDGELEIWLLLLF